jgi:hypothetical protein
MLPVDEGIFESQEVVVVVLVQLGVKLGVLVSDREQLPEAVESDSPNPGQTLPSYSG